MASPPSTEIADSSTYAAQLRKEIAQLRHTLDIRRGEIALTEQRTAELMEKCASIRSASLATSSKAMLVQDLEDELRAAHQEEAILRKEIRGILRATEREDDQRRAEAKRQLAFYDGLLAQADSIAAFCKKKEQEAKERPVRAVGVLLSIAADLADELTGAVDAFQTGMAAADRQAIRLQNVHSSCIEEIALAAERNEQQREALEESWQREQLRLQKELLDVRNRAREAEFHRQRSPRRVDDDGSKTTGYSGGLKKHYDMNEKHALAAEIIGLESRISHMLKQRAAERPSTDRQQGTQ
jgi:hypothetical protein